MSDLMSNLKLMLGVTTLQKFHHAPMAVLAERTSEWMCWAGLPIVLRLQLCRHLKVSLNCLPALTLPSNYLLE